MSIECDVQIPALQRRSSDRIGNAIEILYMMCYLLVLLNMVLLRAIQRGSNVSIVSEKRHLTGAFLTLEKIRKVRFS